MEGQKMSAAQHEAQQQFFQKAMRHNISPIEILSDTRGQEMRLECLKLASQHAFGSGNTDAETLIVAAAKLADFVINGFPKKEEGEDATN